MGAFTPLFSRLTGPTAPVHAGVPLGPVSSPMTTGHVVDTVKTGVVVAAATALATASGSDPRSYNPGIGDATDLLGWIKSTDRLIDGTIDVANKITQYAGVSLSHPTGFMREMLDIGVGGAVAAWSMRKIYSEYNKLMLSPGREPFSSAIKTMYYYMGIGFVERLAVDNYNAVLRHGAWGLYADEINWNAYVAGLAIWALTSPIWPWTAKLAFPLSAPFTKLFMPSVAHSGKFISSAGEMLPANEDAARYLIEKAGSGKLSFSVTAEHMAQADVAAAASRLGSAEASVAFKYDGESYAASTGLLVALNKAMKEASGTTEDRVSVTAKYSQPIEAETIGVRDGKTVRAGLEGDKGVPLDNGTLLQGSVIVLKDDQITLKVSTKVADLVKQADGGVIAVVKGILEGSESVPVKHGEFPKRLEDAEFAVVVKGPADKLLPTIGEGIAERPVSENPLSPLNLTPKAARRKLRTTFAPTNLTVTVLPPAQASDAYAADLLKAAAQDRTIAKLPTPARIEFSRPALEHLLTQGQNVVTLRVNDAVLKQLEPYFDAQASRWGYEFPGTGVKALVSYQADGITYFDVATKDLAEQAKNAKSLFNKLAQKKLGIFGGEKALMIELPNPQVNAASVWASHPTEDVSFKAKAGDTTSLGDILQKDQSFVESALVYAQGAKNSLSFGRAGSAAARTLAGFALSASIVFGMKMGQGWPAEVALPASMRVIVSSSLNNAAAPGTVNLVGASNFSAFKYYIPSVTWLTLFDFITELSESDVLLFDQKVQTLLHEDRPAAREALARQIQQLESDTFRTRPELRAQFLEARLANLIATGVVEDGDAQRLMQIYQSHQDSPSYRAHFLAALMFDDALREAVSADSVAGDFFAAQAADNATQVADQFAAWGIAQPAGFNTTTYHLDAPLDSGSFESNPLELSPSSGGWNATGR